MHTHTAMDSETSLPLPGVTSLDVRLAILTETLYEQYKAREQVKRTQPPQKTHQPMELAQLRAMSSELNAGSKHAAGYKE